MRIEYIDINSIKAYEGNAKIHTDEQIKQIKQSILRYGMNDPIATWHNEVVEGHGRLIACKELGHKEIPVIRLDNLTDEERKAYTLIHNKLTMNTGFDFILLEQELARLDADMDVFGFTELEDFDESNLDEIFQNPQEEKEKKHYHCPLCGEEFEK